MKKIYFAIAACAMFAFAACNNSTESTEGDSTMTDSSAMAPEATPAPEMNDTMHNMADSTHMEEAAPAAH